MVNEVDKLLDSIKIVFSDYEIVKILKSYSQDITNNLIKEKSEIQNNLKKKIWKTIQLNDLNNSSSEIESNVTKCYNLFNEFYSTLIKSNRSLYKNFKNQKFNEIKKDLFKLMQQKRKLEDEY